MGEKESQICKVGNTVLHRLVSGLMEHIQMQIQLVTLLIQDNSCLGMRLGQNDNEIPKAIQHCNNVGFWARPGLGWVWA